MFWILAVVILAADHLIKLYVNAHLALLESHAVIDGVLSIMYVQNVGAAFSILSGQRWFLLVIALVTIGAILFYRHKAHPTRLIDLSLACIVGGAIGNMIDRFAWGYVVDYISIGWWPVFNLADIAICCGAAGLLIGIFLQDKAGKKHGN